MGSEIKTPTLQLRASNIFNADGVTPIYSAGEWALKNNSAVTTFSVNIQGALTAGYSNTNGIHLLQGTTADFQVKIINNYSPGNALRVSGASSTFSNTEWWNYNNTILLGKVTGAGVWQKGPDTANVVHTDYGAVKSIYQAYTGGGTRTLSTAPANFITKKSYFDSFTNLTTSEWALIGGDYFQMGSILFTIVTVGGSILTFLVTSGFTTGDNWYIGASTPTGNCTVSVTGLVLTVTQGTLVFTITFGAYLAATIKANALETGTTVVITELTQTRTQI